MANPPSSLSQLTRKIKSKENFILPEDLNPANFGKVKASEMLDFVAAAFKTFPTSKDIERCVVFARGLELGSEMTLTKAAPFMESLLNESSNQEAAFLGLFEIFIDKQSANKLPSEQEKQIFRGTNFTNFLKRLLENDQRNAKQLEVLGKIISFLWTNHVVLDLDTDSVAKAVAVRDYCSEYRDDFSPRIIWDKLRDLRGATFSQVTDRIWQCGDFFVQCSSPNSGEQLASVIREVLATESFAEQNFADTKAAVGRILCLLEERGIAVSFGADKELGKQAKDLQLEYRSDLAAIESKLVFLNEFAQEQGSAGSEDDLRRAVENLKEHGILISFEERLNEYEVGDRTKRFGFDEWSVVMESLSSSSDVVIDEVAEKLFLLQERGIKVGFVDRILDAQAQELKERCAKKYANPSNVKKPTAGRVVSLSQEDEIWL